MQTDKTTTESKQPLYKVYAIDPLNTKIDIGGFNKVDDAIFIAEAKRQGLVWDLHYFEDAFNNDEVSDQWFIRFICSPK